MDFANMSRTELLAVAKDRRIKQYYIMKRAQLIQLLSMNELPTVFKIEKMTIHQLRDEAKRRGMRGFWTLHRDRLVELLFPNEDVDKTAPNKDQQNKRHTNKHDNPEDHDPQEVGVENAQDV